MRSQLCEIKTKMLSILMGQLDHLEELDVCELGEAIDIIKDIAEAEYYCSVVHAMDNREPSSVNTASQTHDVNTYLHALANDVHEMLETMSPEERMMMRSKLHDLEQLM